MIVDLPQHDLHEFGPKRHAHALLIPVINEGERIRSQLTRITELSLPIDVILADGGSSDGSVDPEFLKERAVRTLLVKTGPGKLSAQLRMGLAYAVNQHYEGVVLIDGNNKDNPAEISRFIDKLEQGYDYVQGSRFLPGGEAVRNPRHRTLAIQMIHAPLISWSAGFRYSDTTNGFRACSRRFLTDARVAPFRDVFQTYELHYYLSIQAPRLGYKVTEVPVTRTYPNGGPIPTKISPLKGNLEVLRTLFKSCLRHYDPKDPGGVR